MDKMEREGLFNRHFLEFFGNEINLHKAVIGQSMADSIWDALTERAQTTFLSDAKTP